MPSSVNSRQSANYFLVALEQRLAFEGAFAKFRSQFERVRRKSGLPFLPITIWPEIIVLKIGLSNFCSELLSVVVQVVRDDLVVEALHAGAANLQVESGIGVMFWKFSSLITNHAVGQFLAYHVGQF